DPAGDGHGPDRIAECRPGWWRNVVVLLDPEGDAGPAPVRERVVGASIRLGAAAALAVTAHVDDLRVALADVIDVDLQLRTDRRQLVREEHVTRLGELVEDLESVRSGEIEAEALLAAVRVLEQHVHIAAERDGAARCETAHGVAPLDVLDLDHL